MMLQIGAYILVDFWSLTCEGRTIRRDAVLDKSAIDEFDTFSVSFACLGNRKVHSHCSVDLNVDISRSKDLAAEIYDSIWHTELIVKHLLRVDDDALGRVDPQVLLDQLSIGGKSAIRKFDEHGMILVKRLDNHVDAIVQLL